MFCRLKSATTLGIEALVIDIEVDLKKGLPSQTIVGLPDPAVREAKERVHSAIRNSGYDFPLGSLTINLAPASQKKEGSIFDLAIALGILIVSGKIEVSVDLSYFIMLGELSLDGFVRPVRGVISILEKARENGITDVLLPHDNISEAMLISGLNIIPVGCLGDAVTVISENPSSEELEIRKPEKTVQGKKFKTGEKIKTGEKFKSVNLAGDFVNKGSGKDLLEHVRIHKTSVDFSEIGGQHYAIRAIEIAVAGGHNLLLIGSPGAGKTMLAYRIPTIMPGMSEEEALETTKIYSIAGMLASEHGLIEERPFRSPHHTASEAAIIGGGRNPLPGEVTLSHNGVLFLDEFSEFRSNIIQSLRQPVESGLITVSRADFRITYPARFMLVAAMNPCPCGYFFDTEKICRCTEQHLNSYFRKISGPILDRIDIQVEVKPLKASDIVDGGPSESSNVIRGRVMKARSVQRERYKFHGIKLNAQMTQELIKKYCDVSSETRDLLYAIVKKFNFSMRSYLKILRVARTIADLSERDDILAEDILEATSYREIENIIYRRMTDRFQ